MKCPARNTDCTNGCTEATKCENMSSGSTGSGFFTVQDPIRKATPEEVEKFMRSTIAYTCPICEKIESYYPLNGAYVMCKECISDLKEIILAKRLNGTPVQEVKTFTATTIPADEPQYEYEMFFDSKPDDVIQIHGWCPIITDRIKNPKNIKHYIETGLLRKIIFDKDEK